MTKNSASDALLELAEVDKNRSEAKRFFETLDAIELALKAGVHREKIIKTLNEQGFAMTLNSFKNALYRARKKRGKLATTTNSSTQTSLRLTY